MPTNEASDRKPAIKKKTQQLTPLSASNRFTTDNSPSTNKKVSIFPKLRGLSTSRTKKNVLDEMSIQDFFKILMTQQEEDQKEQEAHKRVRQEERREERC